MRVNDINTYTPIPALYWPEPRRVTFTSYKYCASTLSVHCLLTQGDEFLYDVVPCTLQSPTCLSTCTSALQAPQCHLEVDMRNMKFVAAYWVNSDPTGQSVPLGDRVTLLKFGFRLPNLTDSQLFSEGLCTFLTFNITK